MGTTDMKVIVGERLNTSRKQIREAVLARDENRIILEARAQLENGALEARAQLENGATHIDVNAGAGGGNEKEDLEWLVHAVQKSVDAPLCIDSPNPEAILGVLAGLRHRPLINSISLEAKRFEALGPLVKEHDCDIVGLCMSDEGMPADEQEIVKRAALLIEALGRLGVAPGRIYIDPLVQPVGANHLSGRMVLSAMRSIRRLHPESHLICGLSNISFGMPRRKEINRVFLTMAMAAGLDSAILDPLDAHLMSDLKCARMLLGADPYCLKYLKACK